MTGGKRKVTRVTEITGMEGDGIQMHDFFRYEQTGVDGNGQAIGCFIVCGIRPRCCDKIESRGVPLPAELFQRRKIEATKLQP